MQSCVPRVITVMILLLWQLVPMLSCVDYGCDTIMMMPCCHDGLKKRLLLENRCISRLSSVIS
jgi:hypothetical protein